MLFRIKNLDVTEDPVETWCDLCYQFMIAEAACFDRSADAFLFAGFQNFIEKLSLHQRLAA